MAKYNVNTNNSNFQPMQTTVGKDELVKPDLDFVVDPSANQSVFTETEPVIVNNDALNVISENIIILSDEPKHPNVVVLPAVKSHYTDLTVEKEFDTKIWQLITPENPPPGFIENSDGGLEPEPVPPFEKPTRLFVRARNYRWIVADGVNTTDRWDGHEPWTPAGHETKGKVANPLGTVTLLYAPDDHALFYPREVENYINDDGDSIKEGLDWEWKLDGNVVSTKPWVMINNLRTQGEKWRDVSTPHVMVCKISNEHGFIQTEMNFIVADDILTSDGENQKQLNQGWYVFDEEKYDSNSTEPTEFIDDPKFAPRTLKINKISFKDYGQSNAKEAKFKKDHWDGDFKKEAQYRVNGGTWKLCRDIFHGKDKPWRAYRFQNNDSRNAVELTIPGGSEAQVEFRYVYRYYTGVWPFRKKYHRHYEGIYTWQAPTDNDTTEVLVNNWTVGYRNERK